LKRTRSRGATTVLIADAERAPRSREGIIPVPRAFSASDGDPFPILAARSHNLLLHHLARLRGIEAGNFRYGSKVTEVE
jgi:hypothetical protein